MISKVTVENFKRFKLQSFELSDTVVLAGPNNSGKSTLLQALATWSMALDRWRLGKGRTGAKKRAGTALTRKDFTALPLREFDLLWNQRSTALTKAELGQQQRLGEPRLIHISLQGNAVSPFTAPWSLTMELRYQGPEQIYVKPIPSDVDLPAEATSLSIVHCPPFSGIGSEERRMDRGAQNLGIGRGKPGDILRNLILEVSHNTDAWPELVQDLQDLFEVTLLAPVYDEALTPFIRCEYMDNSAAPSSKGTRAPLDIASAGSGLLQVLLLLTYFYARPSSVLLLDEPDAHLHVILQRQIYDRLRRVAAGRSCQLIIATHSEVILDGTAPSRVISFLGAPHRLVREEQRDQVREAMGRLTTLDLLLAERERAILYCEGESDFKILRGWADVLSHSARRFFENPFFHSNEGRNPREARAHLFSLRAIHPEAKGTLLLDGDNRNLPDREIASDGLTVIRWTRYEIENYLLVPEAIRRFLSLGDGTLFSVADADAAIEYMRKELPPAAFDDPLRDNATLMSVRASKDVLPQVCEAAGRPMEKEDFFLIAERMGKKWGQS